MLDKIFSLSTLALITALGLSGIAAWYSIIGLTAIFAGAVIPVIIMGGALEFAKIVVTVWLRHYWHRCNFFLKSYLTVSVIVLAMLTSMGIFGFLSRAHIDQGMPTGDVAAQIALIDEKIKVQRDNIEMSRKALTQMDAQIDQRLGRVGSEQAAERAVVLRRQQATERAKIAKDIEGAQREITRLNEERAPIATQLRKVEAEVGPVKYIAALIYGDNPDADLLEKAVRWVIILLVAVFDPLAIMLVLAANASREWDKAEKKTSEDPLPMNTDIDLATQAYLQKPWVHFPSNTPIPVYTPEADTQPTASPTMNTTQKTGTNTNAYDSYSVDNVPDANRVRPSEITFGETAPRRAVRGDMFVGIKSIPHTVMKFDGVNWRRVDKKISTGYLLNDEYVEYLVTEVSNGRYDPDFLTSQEVQIIDQQKTKNLRNQ